MTVEPVSARLLDRKFIGEGFTRLDTWKTDTWHTILIERKDQAVPVDRCHLIKVVGHIDSDIFAFLEAHNRPRGFSVIANALLDEITSVNFNAVDRQVVFTG